MFNEDMGKITFSIKLFINFKNIFERKTTAKVENCSGGKMEENLPWTTEYGKQWCLINREKKSLIENIQKSSEPLVSSSFITKFQNKRVMKQYKNCVLRYPT